MSNVGIFARRVLLRVLLIAGLLCAARCPAEAPRGFDATAPEPHPRGLLPAHGGDVRMAGPFWLELVVAKGSLTVYVADRSGVLVPNAT
jgi:hypothetical protein